MVAIPFDTLKFAEKLEAGGFTAQQARTAAEAFADATSQELSTKADIAVVRSDMEKMELRLASDLRETEMRLRHDLTLRLGAMIAAAVAIVAALMKLH